MLVFPNLPNVALQTLKETYVMLIIASPGRHGCHDSNDNGLGLLAAI